MFSKCLIHSLLLFLLIGGLASVTVSAQTKKKNTRQKPTAPAAAAPVKAEETKADAPQTDPIAKRNSRPADGQTSTSPIPITPQRSGTLYTYEFTQPDFITSRILIEHDDTGKGTVAFQRRGYAETFTEPLTVSESALARLKTAFTALKFLDSTENYQYEKDFSHLGNSRIALTNGQKSRSVTINYSTNKNAKLLMDEYRKVANQAVWIFDVTIARENQPLDGPSQMDALDGLLKRNELSDPLQLLPFLRELADDERLPLIARNHATRIIKQIEKAKK